ncbi:MAG: hypothetical protein JWN25_238, partial [Verrucomicrobiales bacterium]|nr:hypothetical protein [Verrucomicrobiales bacterium]
TGATDGSEETRGATSNHKKTYIGHSEDSNNGVACVFKK